MWRYDQMRYGIVAIALISVSLQIIGFSSLDWLAMETFGQESVGKPQKGKLDGAPGTADDTLSKLEEGKGKPAGANMPDKTGNRPVNVKPGKPTLSADDGVVSPSKPDRPLSAGNEDVPSENSAVKPRPSPIDNAESASDRNKQPKDRSEPPKNDNTPPKDKSEPGSDGIKTPTDKPEQGSDKKRPAIDKPEPGSDKNRPAIDKSESASFGNRPAVDKPGTRPSIVKPSNGGDLSHLPKGKAPSSPTTEGRHKDDRAEKLLPTDDGNHHLEEEEGKVIPTPDRKKRSAESVLIPASNKNEPTDESNTGDRRPAGRPTPTNLVLKLVNRTRNPAMWMTKRPAPGAMSKSTPAKNARPLLDKMGNSTTASNVNKRPTLRPRPWLITRPTPASRPDAKNKYTPSPPQANNGDRAPANEDDALEKLKNTGKLDPSWFRGRQPQSGGSTGGHSAGVADGRTVTKRGRTVMSIGLWTCKMCMANQAGTEDCKTSTAVKGLDVVRLLAPKLSAFDVTASTWHSLRVETVLALLFGLAGLAGFVLGVKPGCLAHRRKPIVVAAICAMTISFILYLVAVTRVAAINEDLRTNFRDLGDSFAVRAPWAAAVDGVGACLALVAAGLQGLSMWMEERRKWSKFQDEVVFTNKSEANATAPPADFVSGSGDESKAGNGEAFA